MDRNLLKRLWNGEKVLCPNCGLSYLVPLHRKRVDNDDFKCLECKNIFRTISIFNKMLK